MHEELATSRQEIQALRRCIEDLRQQFGERERHRIEEQQTVITMHDEARAALECQYETLRMRAEDGFSFFFGAGEVRDRTIMAASGRLGTRAAWHHGTAPRGKGHTGADSS